MWILIIVAVAAAAWMIGSKSSGASSTKREEMPEKVEVIREESIEEKKSASIPAAFWIALGAVLGALAAMFLFSPNTMHGVGGRCLGFDFSGHHVFSPGIFIIVAVIVFAVIVLLKKR